MEVLTIEQCVCGCGTVHYRNSKHQIHRLDGPAVILSDGSKVFYIRNWSVTESEFYQLPEVILYRNRKALEAL